MVVKLERLMLQVFIRGAFSRIATSLVGGDRIGRCGNLCHLFLFRDSIITRV
jgi:hypothetical protein